MSVTRFIRYIHFINFIFNLKREIFFDIFRQNLTAGGIIVYFSNGQNDMCYIIKFHVNHRYVMYYYILLVAYVSIIPFVFFLNFLHSISKLRIFFKISNFMELLSSCTLYYLITLSFILYIFPERVGM